MRQCQETPVKHVEEGSIRWRPLKEIVRSIRQVKSLCGYANELLIMHDIGTALRGNGINRNPTWAERVRASTE